jgi:hypothetical protein
VFVRKTGQIIAAVATYDAGRGTFQEQSRADVLDRVRGTVQGQRSLDELEVLGTDLPPHAVAEGYRVDADRGEVVPKLRLELVAERRELEGDGSDSVGIALRVVDAEGRVAGDFDGQVQVATTRGRLSERGGRLRVTAGQATFRLASVAETVAQVVVSAHDPSGRAGSATIDLEFL